MQLGEVALEMLGRRGVGELEVALIAARPSECVTTTAHSRAAQHVVPSTSGAKELRESSHAEACVLQHVVVAAEVEVHFVLNEKRQQPADQLGHGPPAFEGEHGPVAHD
jgi:hypothetical protein